MYIHTYLFIYLFIHIMWIPGTPTALPPITVVPLATRGPPNCLARPLGKLLLVAMLACCSYNCYVFIAILAIDYICK